MINILILCLLFLLFGILIKMIYSNRKQRSLIQKEKESIKALKNQNAASILNNSR